MKQTASNNIRRWNAQDKCELSMPKIQTKNHRDNNNKTSKITYSPYAETIQKTRWLNLHVIWITFAKKMSTNTKKRKSRTSHHCLLGHRLLQLHALQRRGSNAVNQTVAVTVPSVGAGISAGDTPPHPSDGWRSRRRQTTGLDDFVSETDDHGNVASASTCGRATAHNRPPLTRRTFSVAHLSQTR